ncbi:DUF4387 family protein [Actibacterium sp. 188UL27-1]|uniref:DUF4387 family protein n=1 Tax=Actibacterium sp. 188UL27-1 TaxID=2786961 RepID=UPI00195CE562|nr:DUF4387 family protein [Actibacterium sp. 188UL27-1]MBM7066855.1 DUF4387 family protein [Actibacterium sp. 188UL27-1]
MPKLGEVAEKVRSKNAGPFWVTIDIFCGTSEAYDQVTTQLTDAHVAQILQTERQLLKRFEIPSLNVVKFSLPRPQIQGHIADRDMHGAALGALMAEIALS